MPRGRHRNSLRLRSLLPPLTAVALASASIGGAWLADDPMGVRVIVAATATVLCTSAVIHRRRDRLFEREIARLQSARIRDEWRTDEKIAELELDLEDYREIRARIERKLTIKRAELARLRGEHATLLNRYARAESQRAAALECARLALDKPAPPPSPLTPAVFLRAKAALDALGRNVAHQRERRASRPVSGLAGSDIPTGRGDSERHRSAGGTAAPKDEHSRAVTRAEALRPARGQGHLEGPAVAVLPLSAAPHIPRTSPESGFDYFGKRELPSAPRPAALTAGGGHDGGVGDRVGDLSDVVGDELAPRVSPADKQPPPQSHLTGHSLQVPAPVEAGGNHLVTSAEERTTAEAANEYLGGEEDASVIDLTEHDETELIEVGGLRALS